MVMLVSCVSAATISEWNLTSDGSAINVNSAVTAGTFASSGVTPNAFGSDGANAENWPTANVVDTAKYFEVTISPKTGNTLTITNINFDYSASIGPASFEAKYSKLASFASPTSLIIKTDVDNVGTAPTSSNLVSISVASGETLTIRWFGYDFTAITNEFYIKDLSILGTVTSTTNEPEEITECALVSNYNDDLEIEIDDIKVISGFGKDNEWLPLDEIEVKIKVDNKHRTEKIKNIEVNWGLYDSNSGDWYIDDKESDFNLKDGDDKTVIITFKLDDNIEDLADYDRLYVWTNDAEINDDNDTPVCASAFEDIDIQTESDFVILDDIQLPSEATCGSNIQLTADIWNIGDSDQEDVWILIKNTELGISEKIMIGDVDAFDKTNLDVLLKIPEDAKESPSYLLTLQVYNEDNDVFENDYDNDEAEFKIPLKVNSCTSSSSPNSVTISASLDSEAKAGEDLIVKATIVNSGTSSSTYTINPTGYTSWANSATTDSSTFTIGSGESKQITITLGVKDTASGEQTFNIEVVSGGEIVKTQPVAVTIEAKSGFSSITGNLTIGSPLIWGIGFINFILIIVIIIVAVKVARK